MILDFILLDHFDLKLSTNVIFFLRASLRARLRNFLGLPSCTTRVGMPSADERICSVLGNQFSAAHNSSKTFLFNSSHLLPEPMNSTAVTFLVK